MTTRLPAFDYRAENGARVLRDGVVAAFFLPESHPIIADRVAVCVNDYVQLVGDARLRWTVDEEGDTFELTPAEQNVLVAAVADGSQPECGLQLFDEENDVPAYRLRYIGLNRSRFKAHWPNAISALLMTFPTELLVDSSLLQRFCTRCASILPLSYGYLTPAFLYAEGAAENAAFDVIRALARRYQCLDIPYISIDFMEIGACAKGAYWATYIGRDMLNQLGDSHFVTEVARFATTQALSNGACAIALSENPQSGDVNRREDLAAYERLFSLLSPVALTPTVAFPTFSDEETRGWYGRFAAHPVGSWR
jgi:hypothetical protein